ncbi:9526_t:CDS:2, partial [Funneliformis caledonium]
MNKEQYKSFRDEVIQILSDLDGSLSLDHKNTWNDISDHVSKNIMPAIDKTLNKRMVYNQTELKFILQQLHRHREDLEEIIDDGKYHSDEASETDNEKAQMEINEHIRLKN